MRRLTLALLALSLPARAAEPTLEAPASIPRFDPAELVVRLDAPPFSNPFTEAELTADFTPSGGKPIHVLGFADAPDGKVFRVRFSPVQTVPHAYTVRLRARGIDRRFKGTLRVEPSRRPGPVIVDPTHPHHFVWAATGKPFYHLGYTAYHLLDPSFTDAQIDATIEYCVKYGYNKIRFLLTGYPRDLDGRTSGDVEHGVPDPKKRINYGGKPGLPRALPAWVGAPHAYDFTRFNVPHWQRVDRAVRRMRERGIVATAIVTIEKQDLPDEYGRLTEHELRLYRYAVARLAAFDNVWWDLGNEHNEFRDAAWGEAMGATVKAIDPHDRLTSAHAYATFLYPTSPWADFVITQQYGDERAVHDWTLDHRKIRKPYVNEEYGYEGDADQPGHLQNADWTRRTHWAIAMAGGYATYGDWHRGVSFFYMGEPGTGVAARQLVHLRAFFEPLPFPELQPRDDLTTAGFGLARPPDLFLFYLPRGGKTTIDLSTGTGRLEARWFDPRTGKWQPGPKVGAAKAEVAAPSAADWALLVRAR